MDSTPLNDLALEAKRCIDEYNSRYHRDVNYEDALEQIRTAIGNLSVAPKVRKVALANEDACTSDHGTAEHPVCLRGDASWEDDKGLEYWLPPKRSRVDGSAAKKPGNSDLSKWLPKGAEPTSSVPLGVSFGASWFRFAQDKVWLTRSSNTAEESEREGCHVTGVAERTPDLYTFWVQYTSTKCWLAMDSGSCKGTEQGLDMTGSARKEAELMDLGVAAERTTHPHNDVDVRQWLPDLQRTHATTATALALYLEPAYTEKWLSKTCSSVKPDPHVLQGDYLFMDNQDFEVI